MKFAALYLLVLAGAMAGGYLLRDATAPDVATAPAPPNPDRPSVTEPAEPWIEDALKKRSVDTIEDLVANNTSTRLPRMTLWLVDATSDEILELWRTLDERDELDMRTYDLILIHWTELDPRGAIAAAKASRHEGAAWWAWGRAEPELALRTALREAPNYADNVLRAIGQFRINQALVLMENYPEALAHTSIEGIGSGLKRDDPEQAVAFLRSHGQSGYEALKTWAERDPDSALAWARTNLRDTTGSDLEHLVSELVVEHPDRVENWLNGLPTGGLRSALATEYIKHLADQDIDKAIAFAREEKGLVGRTKLMAAIGDRLAYHEPDRSLALLGETMREHRDSPNSYVHMTGGGGINEWRARLLASHPRETLDMVVELSDDPRHHQDALQTMSKWMQRDEAAFAGWLMDQPSRALRDQGATSLVHHLISGSSPGGRLQPDYESALGWAASIQNEPDRHNSLSTVLVHWMRADPEGARTHVEGLPIDDPARQNYELRQKR